MNQNSFNELFEKVCEEVEVNTSYYREDETDNRRYWTGPEIIDALTWGLLNIGIPILTGVASGYLTNKVSKEKKKEADVLINNINIYNSNSNSFSSSDKKKEAIQEMINYLTKHGWPKSEAKENSEEVVKIIQTYLNTDTSTTRTILFLAADPVDSVRLRLGDEIREIHEKLQLSKNRDFFTLEQRWSTGPTQLSQALIDTRPYILHFSGHGSSSGELCFQDKNGQTHPISKETLSMLFKPFKDNLKCLLLNACFSINQVKILKKDIDFIIGMDKAIGDKAAIAFSIGFYQGIGGGLSIEDSFNMGCAQIAAHSIPEFLTPKMIK